MNVKDLLESIKTDECGFTNKVDNIDDYYLVKISMDENIYRHQGTFYILFSQASDNTVTDLVYANITMSEYYFIAHVLGTKDDNGIFRPLTDSSFEDEEYSINKSEQLYVRDYAMRTNYITNVEVVTYG